IGNEPYRMFTSRAEYRLLLREDNADVRLAEVAKRVGAVGADAYTRAQQKAQLVAAEIQRLEATTLTPSSQLNERLRACRTAETDQPATLAQLLRRPELSYDAVYALATDTPNHPSLPAEVVTQIEVSVKYAGYVKRQQEAVERFKRLESTLIPPDMDFAGVA